MAGSDQDKRAAACVDALRRGDADAFLAAVGPDLWRGPYPPDDRCARAKALELAEAYRAIGDDKSADEILAELEVQQPEENPGEQDGQ